MTDREIVKNEMDSLRLKLERLVEAKEASKDEILKLSKEMDKLLNQYYSL